ncbi:MAG: hypothetical protein H0U95_08210 [Bacteroidetes bacterium]|nr:hypothetical protein [Bacteroidota bacterium]
MKNKIIKIIALTLLVSIAIPSCKKYVDGPRFSLLTKKARLAGDWKIESVTTNGNDQTASYKALVGDNYIFTIDKDEKYKVTGNFPDDGTYKWGEDKDDVYFTSNVAGSKEQACRILRLKSKELWLRTTAFNGDMTITKYKQ